MRKLLHLLKYTIPYIWYAVLNILFNILGVAFSIVSFAAIVPVLNILFKLENPSDSMPEFSWNFENIKNTLYYYIGSLVNVYGQTKALAYICLSVIVLFLLKNLFSYFALFFMVKLRNGVVKDIRDELYLKILILPLRFFSEKKKGDIIARMTTDIQEVEWSIMSSLEMIFRDPIAIIWFLTTLFIMNSHLTLMVLLILPLTGLLIGWIGKSLRRTSIQGQKKMGELLALIEETIGGLRIIKSFNAINWAFQNFKNTNQQYSRLIIRLSRKRDLAAPLSEFLGILVSVFIIWYGGKMILSGSSSMDASMFILYIVLFSQVITPVKSLTTAYYNVQRGLASIERIEDILNAEEVIIEKENAIELKHFNDKIVFQNVSFKYETNIVLNNINLTIEKGKTIALVGVSGGGKSTLVDLLPRFYDTTSGDILIDNINIRDIVISDVRALMGVVSQETILFNGTIFDNIAFGLKNISIEDVVNAAKIANAHEFIELMPKGYYTNIGDRGIKMSGGQRQRLSIARAILINPPILILDEATSSLDSESERLVQEALQRIMVNRTSIVVAHRLSTIKFADEIIVLKDGCIVERGTHNELIGTNGVYKKLYTIQNLE